MATSSSGPSLVDFRVNPGSSLGSKLQPRQLFPRGSEWGAPGPAGSELLRGEASAAPGARSARQVATTRGSKGRGGSVDPGGADYKSRQASGRAGRCRSGARGQPGPGVRGGSREWRGGSSRLSAVALCARAGVVAAIGREVGGAGCCEPQLVQAEREEAEAERAAGQGGARRSAAFRPGHGSGAPESVHRGLGELVSGGGPAARAPPAGSPSAGRPRAHVPATAWAPGTARGEAGRAASRPGWAPRVWGGRAEALGGEALGPCARGGGAERGAAHRRAPVCARCASRRAHGGHLLAMPGGFAQHPQGVLHFSWAHRLGRGVGGGSSVLAGVSESRKPRQRGLKGACYPGRGRGRLCPSKCGSRSGFCEV